MASKLSTYLAIYLYILLHLIYCNACIESPAPQPAPANGNDGSDESPSRPPEPADIKYCPRDALKFGICAGMLSMDFSIGDPPVTPCCSLMQYMAGIELGICLCTAIKANVLGMDLNVPLSFTMLINACGQKTPTDFQCE